MKNSKKAIYRRLVLPVFLALMTTNGCKKFVEIPAPINQLTAESTFSSDATASSAIVGIYSRMSQGGMVQSITPSAGMYADELLNYGTASDFSQSLITRSSSGTLNSNFWNLGYQYIYFCNSAMEQLPESNGVSPALKNSLSGEAKFLRAYLYLQLASLFGDVPLVTSTDFAQNASLPRSPKPLILDQVNADLKEAVALLPEVVESEKIRANRYAAMALSARAALYGGDWANAERLSDAVIESKKYLLATDLSKVFLKNSTEAILQLYPTQSGQNTPDGLTFLPASANEQPKYTLTATLLDAFEPGDLRKSAWTATRTYLGQQVSYPAKYKVLNTATLSEYLMVLRLSEQYLIRAEARIQLGETAKGIADLNLIRKRARPEATTALPNPLPDLNPAMGKADALLAVETERRRELFCENGHRWFDLQRTGRAPAVLAALKPATWIPSGILWPIPAEQLLLNPFLIQNPGYNL
ncbi:RagB/SusD family nutrient uptake outer membrane protein [Pedobacter sp. KBW01]|uniref:RagB/SusD family nutrient uptake outer membrane protein n=1 Tax=Pedobacter sp. KBW01 TaxID=2153364 RepID=UPI000F59E6F3|nr:RagB/SusD family nutrient uptake outer membrane protein [Pedobacter sp. KBW01]RQO77788.1 RagB/SusD family nutrient uptake outer membrane protein [Pedobacter sp. KBW01]